MNRRSFLQSMAAAVAGFVVVGKALPAFAKEGEKDCKDCKDKDKAKDCKDCKGKGKDCKDCKDKGKECKECNSKDKAKDKPKTTK